MRETNVSSLKKIRILHIIGGMNRAGAETWLYNLTRASDLNKFQIDFLVHGDYKYDYEDDLTALGSEFIRCKATSGPIRYVFRMQKILQLRQDYQIIHSHIHFYSAFSLLGARLSGNKNLICHSHSSINGISGKHNLARWLYNKITTQIINWLCKIKIAVSNEAAETLFGKHSASAGDVYILPCGINIPATSTKEEREKMRNHFGINQDEIVLGHAGRLEKEKNHVFILQVFDDYLRHNPKARLVIMGRGSLENDIKQLAKTKDIYDRIIFTGAVSNSVELMEKLLDIFIFPSVREGIPLALLEAQAVGLPTIMSTNIPIAAQLNPTSAVRLSLEDPVEKWGKTISDLYYKDRQSLKDKATISQKSDEWI